MEMNFSAVLANLTPGSLLDIMAASRNDADYYLTTILPERNMPQWNAEAGNMTVRTTMAGLAGMDGPYPPGGLIQAQAFNEKLAKIAISSQLDEETLRTIIQFGDQYILSNNGAGAPGVQSFLTTEALNFFQKVIVQAIKDTREYLRGQALTGAIDWTFNNKTLSVDYGFPTANTLTARTGNDAYDGSASKFWADIKSARKLLRNSTQIVFLTHPDTADAIIYNTVNSANVVNMSNSAVTLQKVVGDNRVPTGDARETVTIITYGAEGEVLDPATPGTTVKVPFIERGYLHAIGTGNNRGYQVGQGSTPDPINDFQLGYTHIGRTTEGGGSMGDWGRLYVPEARPMQLSGEGVCNCLPVIERYDAVVNAHTTIS